MIYKFTFNGICKVPLKGREIVLDKEYITSDIDEINTLKSLKFKHERIDVSKPEVAPEATPEVKKEKKSKAPAKRKKKVTK